MDKKELLKLINEDDRTILTEKQLAEAKTQTELLNKQISLLDKIVEQTEPAIDSGLNNWINVLHLDLSTPHTSYEVWKWTDGMPQCNSIVIPAQDVDFKYELVPGQLISIDAGLIMDITGHDVKLLRISNEETITAVMDIILSGVDSSNAGASSPNTT